MIATDKARLTVHLDPNVDEMLRIFCVKHRKQLSGVTEAALLHSLEDHHFLEKLTKKEEIDR